MVRALGGWMLTCQVRRQLQRQLLELFPDELKCSLCGLGQFTAAAPLEPEVAAVTS